MSDNFLFTFESVSEGHPDKVADQISDAVLHAVPARPCYPGLTKGDCELTRRKIIDR